MGLPARYDNNPRPICKQLFTGLIYNGRTLGHNRANREFALWHIQETNMRRGYKL